MDGCQLHTYFIPAQLATPDQPIPGGYSLSACIEDISEDSSLTFSGTTSGSPKSPLPHLYSDVAASRSLSPMLSDMILMLYSLGNPLDAQMAKSSIDEQVGPCTQLPLVKVEDNDQGWTTVSCKKDVVVR